MRKLISALLAASMLLSMAACSNNADDDTDSTNTSASTEQSESSGIDSAEILQNDYRGGVTRTYALQEAVLNLMEQMKSNNAVLRQDNPNSFWTAGGYQDFVISFLNSPVINDTQWFNEEETDWATITSQMVSVDNSFTKPSDGAYVSKYSSLKILRNEKDDYSITGINGNATAVVSDWNRTETGKYSGDYEYRVLYDCNNDWCKAYVTLDLDTDELPDITAQIYEYARIDNDTFAIQTSRERLVVVLKPVEADTDLREREITEFYYSKLVAEGARSSFVPFTPKSEYDEYGTYSSNNVAYNKTFASYSLINENGDIATRYGKKDSIFLKEDIVESINRDWVFEEAGLQQSIVYKNGALVVTTYNKLSEQYERFIYALSDVSESLVKELEDLVDMDKLIGVQDIPEVELETPINKFNHFTPEEMDEMGFSYDKDGNVVDEAGRIVISVIDGKSHYEEETEPETEPLGDGETAPETTTTIEEAATEAVQTEDSEVAE